LTGRELTTREGFLPDKKKEPGRDEKELDPSAHVMEGLREFLGMEMVETLERVGWSGFSKRQKLGGALWCVHSIMQEAYKKVLLGLPDGKELEITFVEDPDLRDKLNQHSLKVQEKVQEIAVDNGILLRDFLRMKALICKLSFPERLRASKEIGLWDVFLSWYEEFTKTAEYIPP